ncbi:MAG: response regulator [Pseudomonadota bacterium]
MGNGDMEKKIRILLVDDEEGFVTILAKRMSRRNFDVTTAGNGADAIRILRHQDFDIALLDYKMEGLDGVEVLKIFKMMAPELPVIILTGHGDQAAAADGQKYGAADYIRKPHDFEELLNKIHLTLKKV